MPAPEAMTTIYKICPLNIWDEASTAEQVKETAARHFAGQNDLVLLTVDSAALGDRLKWEPSRGGALFPHLYDVLDVKHVLRAEKLPLGADGRHVFPDLA
jgi:uncharacterized protein (DUF952 family)